MTDPPTTYAIRVDGHLDDHWAAWFDGLTLSHEADGTTCFTGVVTDQSHLHGLLARIRDVGAILISITALDATQEVPHRKPE